MQTSTDDTDTPGAGLRRADRYDHTVQIGDGERAVFLCYRPSRGGVRAICYMSSKMWGLRWQREPRTETETMIPLGRSYQRGGQWRTKYAASFDSLDRAKEVARKRRDARIRSFMRHWAFQQTLTERKHAGTKRCEKIGERLQRRADEIIADEMGIHPDAVTEPERREHQRQAMDAATYH